MSVIITTTDLREAVKFSPMPAGLGLLGASLSKELGNWKGEAISKLLTAHHEVIGASLWKTETVDESNGRLVLQWISKRVARPNQGDLVLLVHEHLSTRGVSMTQSLVYAVIRLERMVDLDVWGFSYLKEHTRPTAPEGFPHTWVLDNPAGRVRARRGRWVVEQGHDKVSVTFAGREGPGSEDMSLAEVVKHIEEHGTWEGVPGKGDNPLAAWLDTVVDLAVAAHQAPDGPELTRAELEEHLADTLRDFGLDVEFPEEGEKDGRWRVTLVGGQPIAHALKVGLPRWVHLDPAIAGKMDHERIAEHLLLTLAVS